MHRPSNGVPNAAAALGAPMQPEFHPGLPGRRMSRSTGVSRLSAQMSNLRGRHRFTYGVSALLTCGLGGPAAGCCPSVAGPTAPAASYSVTLAAGEVRFFDAETPASTTQVNLTFRI